MMVQVERPLFTDWLLGSVSAILDDRVQVEGTVAGRIWRSDGQFTEPDGVSATAIVPEEWIGEQEAEVLQW
jgi:hypothetical protein